MTLEFYQFTTEFPHLNWASSRNQWNNEKYNSFNVFGGVRAFLRLILTVIPSTREQCTKQKKRHLCDEWRHFPLNLSRSGTISECYLYVCMCLFRMYQSDKVTLVNLLCKTRLPFISLFRTSLFLHSVLFLNMKKAIDRIFLHWI